VRRTEPASGPESPRKLPPRAPDSGERDRSPVVGDPGPHLRQPSHRADADLTARSHHLARRHRQERSRVVARASHRSRQTGPRRHPQGAARDRGQLPSSRAPETPQNRWMVIWLAGGSAGPRSWPGWSYRRGRCGMHSDGRQPRNSWPERVRALTRAGRGRAL
jgi:hypothetical protein